MSVDPIIHPTDTFEQDLAKVFTNQKTVGTAEATSVACALVGTAWRRVNLAQPRETKAAVATFLWSSLQNHIAPNLREIDTPVRLPTDELVAAGGVTRGAFGCLLAVRLWSAFLAAGWSVTVDSENAALAFARAIVRDVALSRWCKGCADYLAETDADGAGEEIAAVCLDRPAARAILNASNMTDDALSVLDALFKPLSDAQVLSTLLCQKVWSSSTVLPRAVYEWAFRLAAARPEVRSLVTRMDSARALYLTSVDTSDEETVRATILFLMLVVGHSEESSEHRQEVAKQVHEEGLASHKAALRLLARLPDRQARLGMLALRTEALQVRPTNTEMSAGDFYGPEELLNLIAFEPEWEARLGPVHVPQAPVDTSTPAHELPVAPDHELEERRKLADWHNAKRIAVGLAPVVYDESYRYVKKQPYASKKLPKSTRATKRAPKVEEEEEDDDDGGVGASAPPATKVEAKPAPAPTSRSKDKGKGKGKVVPPRNGVALAGAEFARQATSRGLDAATRVAVATNTDPVDTSNMPDLLDDSDENSDGPSDDVQHTDNPDGTRTCGRCGGIVSMKRWVQHEAMWCDGK